jgi:type II secretory pathway pseudopilin PulG
MQSLKGQRGLSLIEVTIMLLVLMLLTGVLAPSIMDYVKDAQWVKVKEDCEAIAVSVVRLTRDVGPCLTASAAGGCSKGNRIDVLVGDGAAAVSVAGPAYSSGNIDTSNWDTAGPGNLDTMENQFVRNGPGYSVPSAQPGFPVGPQFGLGWRGAYLSPPIGPDPWGHRYYVNTGFLATAVNASSSSYQGVLHSLVPQPPPPGPICEGCSYGIWTRDVFCLSAGPDGIIHTPFAADGVFRSGDDFVTVIQGSSR